MTTKESAKIDVLKDPIARRREIIAQKAYRQAGFATMGARAKAEEQADRQVARETKAALKRVAAKKQSLKRSKKKKTKKARSDSLSHTLKNDKRKCNVCEKEKSLYDNFYIHHHKDGRIRSVDRTCKLCKRGGTATMSAQEAVSALRSALGFVRHVQHACPQTAENAMEQETLLEDVLERYFNVTTSRKSKPLSKDKKKKKARLSPLVRW